MPNLIKKSVTVSKVYIYDSNWKKIFIIPFDVIRAPNNCLIFLSSRLPLELSLAAKSDFLGDKIDDLDSFGAKEDPACCPPLGDVGVELQSE